jgi:hypothetical protein
VTAPTTPRLRWTHSVGAAAWVGAVRRTVVLGWDVAEAAWIVVSLTDPRTGAAMEWWLDRRETAKGVDGPVGDWIRPCTFRGVPHVEIRPVLHDGPIRVREDVLGRFLSTTEYWVPLGGAGFDAEAAALLGGAS